MINQEINIRLHLRLVPATTPASGTISLVENIVACAYAWSEVIPSGDYHVSLSYQDPQPQKATSVSVTGPGISGSQILTYNAMQVNGY